LLALVREVGERPVMNSKTAEDILFLLVVLMLTYKVIDLFAASFKLDQSLMRTKRRFNFDPQTEQWHRFLHLVLLQFDRRTRHFLRSYRIAVLLKKNFLTIVAATILSIFAILGLFEAILPANHERYWHSLVVGAASAFASTVTSIIGFCTEEFRRFLEEPETDVGSSNPKSKSATA
jgi:hypothetical protein